MLVRGVADTELAGGGWGRNEEVWTRARVKVDGVIACSSSAAGARENQVSIKMARCTVRFVISMPAIRPRDNGSPGAPEFLFQHRIRFRGSSLFCSRRSRNRLAALRHYDTI